MFFYKSFLWLSASLYFYCIIFLLDLKSRNVLMDAPVRKNFINHITFFNGS